MSNTLSEAMDVSLYQQWYDEHANRILAFIRSRCVSHADADEIFQEVWMRVWRSGSSFDGGNVRAWLFRISRNLIIDNSRKQKPDLLGGETSWDEFVAAWIEEDDERIGHLRDCMKEVGGPFVEVIHGFLSGKSTAEIAEDLGVAEGTVSSRKSRGQNEIEQCVRRKMS